MRYLSANQFEVYEEIGKGGFGVVYRGFDKVTKTDVAIKLINLENTDNIEDLKKEISILSQCRLEQITRYHGCFVKGYKLWIIMEYLDGGSCLDLLTGPGPFDEKYIAILLRELLIALQYLHEHNRIHRDVKAANILLNSKGSVKIADFGVSTQLSNNLSKRNTFVGSPYWMSPEVILEEEYNFKADIWSLGITAIELATGKPPLSTIPPMKALFQIPQNAPPVLTGDEYSSDFKNFLATCLQRNPNRRPTAKKLLEHPFITRAGKNHQLLSLIKRKQVWMVQHSNEKNTPKQKYYVPTIQNINTKDDRIIFDFEDGHVERSDISNVLISKKSPLLTSQISPPSSNTSTIHLDKTQTSSRSSQSTINIGQVFNTTIQKIGYQDEAQMMKLKHICELMNSLDENVLTQFSKEFSKSFNESISGENTSSDHTRVPLKPINKGSEKLLLKRWTDQYFHN